MTRRDHSVSLTDQEVALVIDALAKAAARHESQQDSSPTKRTDDDRFREGATKCQTNGLLWLL
jgi:hypothetical protein